MTDGLFDPVSAAEPAAAPAPLPPATERRGRRRGFAGFSWGQLVTASAFVGLAVWSAWLSRELITLRDKRIVSVNLAAMTNDFVMAEARAGNGPEQTDADTRHYLAALQKVLQDRAGRGEIILVGEAVVSSSVPDLTPEVRAAVGRLITANPAPRVPTAAMPAPSVAPPSMIAGQPAAQLQAAPGAFVPNPPPPAGSQSGAADGFPGN